MLILAVVDFPDFHFQVP